MTDLGNVLVAVVGFLGGLVIGYAVEHSRMKHDLKIEKIGRLSPYLEQVYPAIKDLSIDSEYAVELQQRDTNDRRIFKALRDRLEEYRSWYVAFRQNGMEPELQSLSPDLYNLLSGIFVYSQMSAKYGDNYICPRVNHFHTLCHRGRLFLEKLLSS
jgi:hypothetical protein